MASSRFERELYERAYGNVSYDDDVVDDGLSRDPDDILKAYFRVEGCWPSRASQLDAKSDHSQRRHHITIKGTQERRNWKMAGSSASRREGK